MLLCGIQKKRYYEKPPGIYSVEDRIDYVSKVSKGGAQVEYDDISMKTILIVGRRSVALKFDDKCFFDTLLASALYWPYRSASHPNEYMSVKLIIESAIDKL